MRSLGKGLFASFLVLSGCGTGLQPTSTIVATDLDRQARTETLGSANNGKDPFVEQLNKIEQILEKGFLTAPEGTVDISNIKYNEVTPAVLSAYVEGRYTQVNDLCKIYFDGLSEVAQNADFLTNQLSIAANVATGVLGLAGTAARTLSFLALGEAGILASVENYSDVYFLAPSPSLTFGLVRSAQNEFITLNKDRIAGLTSYPEARDLVRQYAGFCTPAQIRSLIEKLVADGKFVPRDAARQQLKQIASGALLNAVEKASGFKELNSDRLADLALVTGTVGASGEDVGAAQARLKTVYGEDFESSSEFTSLKEDLFVLSRYGVINDVQRSALERAKLRPKPPETSEDSEESNEENVEVPQSRSSGPTAQTLLRPASAD